MIRLFSLFTIYLLSGCGSHIAVDNRFEEKNILNTSPSLISNSTISVIELTNNVISTEQLQVSDVEQASSDLVYELENIPTSGDINLSGSPLNIGDSFTQDDIENNRLSYMHKYELANDTAPGSDSFTFSYSDGIDDKVTGNTVTLNIANFCDDKSSATSFSAYGDGSDADPYLICTLSQLNSIGLDNSSWSSSFKLKSSINMGPLAGTSYNIIGNQSVKFTGNFDGRNNTLSNFNYSDISGNYIGVFGSVDGVGKTIKNIKMTNVNITGQDYVSALVAWVNHTEIHNIDVQGNFACNDYCAGVAGAMSTNLSSFLTANVDIFSPGWHVAGIAGHISFGTLENAFSSGEVTASGNVGGIIGYSIRSNIKNVFNTIDVTGGSVVGGIIGSFADTGRIDNAFNAGDVSANSAGTDFAGMISGNFNGFSSNLYYDNSKTCSNPAPGGSCNSHGSPTSINTGATPTYFYDKTNPPLSSWDFTDGWKENASDYPSFAPTELANDWGSCSDHLSETPFAGGAGTPLNPYVICSAAQLNQIGLDNSNLNKHFVIKNDIDMSEISGSYNMIGTNANPFKGSFSGFGYTISNLTINESANDVGLVGYASEGLFQGMTLASVNVTGIDNTGALIGNSYSPVNIGFSSVTGSVSGQDFTGGLVGRLSRGAMANCYNQATINARDYAGGLAGGSDFGDTVILYSYNSGAITGQSSVGGLIGGLVGSNNMSSSFSSGAITGTGADVGQLHGTDAAFTITQSYINEDALCSGCDHIRGTNIDTDSAPNYFFIKTNAPLSTWNFSSVWQENSGTFPTLQN